MLRFLLISSFALACSANPTPGDSGNAKLDNAPVLHFTDLTLFTHDNRIIARLFADGRTQGTEPDETGRPAKLVPGPTLHADGTVDLTKGNVRVSLVKDDNISELIVTSPKDGHTQKQVFATISNNQLRIAGQNDEWHARIDGDMLEFSNSAAANRIEGPLNDRIRHTVLVMYAAFFLNMVVYTD